LQIFRIEIRVLYVNLVLVMLYAYWYEFVDANLLIILEVHIRSLN
jgi:hypothetical protein